MKTLTESLEGRADADCLLKKRGPDQTHRRKMASHHQKTSGDEKSTGVILETIKILEKPKSITWDYDDDADVLYLSLGEPVSALGMDIGEGIIVRYDDKRMEVVGLTLLGVRERLLKVLNVKDKPTATSI